MEQDQLEKLLSRLFVKFVALVSLIYFVQVTILYEYYHRIYYLLTSVAVACTLFAAYGGAIGLKYQNKERQEEMDIFAVRVAQIFILSVLAVFALYQLKRY